jgi:hypothetical protein
MALLLLAAAAPGAAEAAADLNPFFTFNPVRPATPPSDSFISDLLYKTYNLHMF